MKEPNFASGLNSMIKRFDLNQSRFSLLYYLICHHNSEECSVFMIFQIILGALPILKSIGEERERAVEEQSKLIRVFEDGMKKDFPGKFPFYHGKSLGLLDIVVGPNACNYLALFEVVGDVIDSKRNPDFFTWVDALKEHPLIKEALPAHHKMVQKLKEKIALKPKDS